MTRNENSRSSRKDFTLLIHRINRQLSAGQVWNIVKLSKPRNASVASSFSSEDNLLFRKFLGEQKVGITRQKKKKDLWWISLDESAEHQMNYAKMIFTDFLCESATDIHHDIWSEYFGHERSLQKEKSTLWAVGSLDPKPPVLARKHPSEYQIDIWSSLGLAFDSKFSHGSFFVSYYSLGVLKLRPWTHSKPKGIIEKYEGYGMYNLAHHLDFSAAF